MFSAFLTHTLQLGSSFAHLKQPTDHLSVEKQCLHVGPEAPYLPCLGGRGPVAYIARMTKLPGYTLWACDNRGCAYGACEQLRICTKHEKKLGYILCTAISKGSHRIFAHFNIVFELDSGLFLAAAAAGGAQQSNKQQYDMLHPLFYCQVGRAPGTVGRAPCRNSW